MSEEEQIFNDVGATITNSEKSQMFGKPCFKLNKKAFACFFENCMVFKLDGEAHEQALSLSGSKLFDPSGKNRPMKAWVQVTFEHRTEWLIWLKQLRILLVDLMMVRLGSPQV